MKWQKISLVILALACCVGSIYYFTHNDNVMGVILWYISLVLCVIGLLSCGGGHKVEDE